MNYNFIHKVGIGGCIKMNKEKDYFKNKWKRLRKFLVRKKIYMLRTLAYMNIMNSGMILFLFLSKLKEAQYISFDISKYIVLIFVGGMIGLAFVGWIETNILGGFHEESTINFTYNPPMSDMRRKVNEIYTHLGLEKNTKP